MKARENSTYCKAAIVAVCVVISVIVLLPLLWVIFTSIRETFAVLSAPFSLPETIKMQNFITVWTEARFNRFFLNSVIITGCSLGLILLVSLLAAYGLSILLFRGNRLLLMFFVLGIGISSQAILIPLFLVMKIFSLLDSYPTLILAYGGWCTLSVFILVGFFQSVPSEIIEAAKIDGCSEFWMLWKIIVPLSKPAISAVSIFYFVFIWNDFIYPLILTTSEDFYTVQLGVKQFQGRYMVNYPQICAALILSCLLPVVFYVLFQKGFQKGLTEGALKV